MVIYVVADSEGPSHHPTLREAMTIARDRKAYFLANDPRQVPYLRVEKVTIDGPLNRALVCKLLSNGGYASKIETVWEAKG